VEELIAEGGMGRVFLSRQLALDKPVVLKILKRSLHSDERTAARFQREARAASRLNHPHSIDILDFGQSEDGALYIAMEYVQGEDLHQILARQGPLPEERVIRIAAQVLSVLAAAHRAGIIHRDLKPENIMVEQRPGEPDFVKVLDFGIAKIMDAGRDEPVLTRLGFVCGTPEYMSPEQARGDELDARSDLYAVGVILFQLMTGKLPFEADSPLGFANQHLTREPPLPSKRRPDGNVSSDMERLILKALSKDPGDRPASANDFRAELLAVRSRPSGPGKVATAPLLTARPRQAAVGADDVTQLNGETRWATTGQTEATEQMASKRRRLFLRAGLAAAVVGLGIYVWARAAFPTEEIPPVPEPLSTRKPQPAPPPPDDIPLYERQVPPEDRDVQAAARLDEEGDRAHYAGDLEAAAQKYREAFEKNPTPEISLKLGEVLFRSGRAREAKSWWRRHLQDRRDSKAKHYIEQTLGQLVQ
jgi:serine/threonine-protein kinase